MALLRDKITNKKQCWRSSKIGLGNARKEVKVGDVELNAFRRFIIPPLERDRVKHYTMVPTRWCKPFRWVIMSTIICTTRWKHVVYSRLSSEYE